MRNIIVVIIGAFLLILIGCGGGGSGDEDKTCSSKNCNGCCYGNVCITNQTDTLCGFGGVACQSCGVGFACSYYGTCECAGGPGCSCTKHSDCNNDACPNYGAACTYWEDQGVETKKMQM